MLLRGARASHASFLPRVAVSARDDRAVLPGGPAGLRGQRLRNGALLAALPRAHPHVQAPKRPAGNERAVPCGAVRCGTVPCGAGRVCGASERASELGTVGTMGRQAGRQEKKKGLSSLLWFLLEFDHTQHLHTHTFTHTWRSLSRVRACLRLSLWAKK